MRPSAEVDALQRQLRDRASPLLHENSYGAVVYRDRSVPTVGVHRFIQDRLRGHAPDRARYAGLLAPGQPRTLTRLLHPDRGALDFRDGMKPNPMLAAHYGQSFY